MAWDVPILGVHHGPAGDLLHLRGRAAAAAFGACCAATVAVSRTIADLLTRDALRLATGRVAIIPPAIDAGFWAAQGPAPQRGNVPRVCMVGSLADTKDHSTLLRAMALLRDRGVDAELRLVGSGPLERAIAAQAGELRLRPVAMLGALEPEGVRQELRAADVVAQITHAEGLSLAVMEAMAARKAVVASDVAGLSELVQDGVTGVLAAEGDTAAVAGALERVLADRQLAARLGAAAGVWAAANCDLAGLSVAYERELAAFARR
jgi:glycosyltransferase involved in cell wall biosynthesis